MIEKLKEYLFFDEHKESEQKNFSIIEVIPRLHFEDNTKDKQSIFDSSGYVVICVRSEEARDEIESYLVAAGFDSVIKLDNCEETVGSHVKRDEPYFCKKRHYYSIEESLEIEHYLINASKIGLALHVELDEVDYFKKVIKELRSKKQYRNIWKKEEGKLIIA